jgi:hypothetical protein
MLLVFEVLEIPSRHTRLDISPSLLACIGPVTHLIGPAIEEAINATSADMRAIEGLNRDLTRQVLVKITGNGRGGQP